MRIRDKVYLQVILRLRMLGVWPSLSDDPIARQISPLLVFVTVVLALWLAILEVDLHRGELQSLGLIGGPFSVDPAFVSP